MIICAALCTNALKPAYFRSLTLLDVDVDIIKCIKHILKTQSLLKKLTSENPVEWLVTNVVLNKLKDKNGGKVCIKNQSYISLGIPLPNPVNFKQ